MQKFICILLLLAISSPSPAQPGNTFDAYEQMQQSASADDSMKASMYLKEVNPYYLLYLHQAPEKLDSFFIARHIIMQGNRNV